MHRIPDSFNFTKMHSPDLTMMRATFEAAGIYAIKISCEVVIKYSTVLLIHSPLSLNLLLSALAVTKALLFFPTLTHCHIYTLHDVQPIRP